MRIKLEPIVGAAEKMLAGIAAKSYYHTCQAAHECLCAMPSPVWAEEASGAPGMAHYYFQEHDANAAMNFLRGNVCLWIKELVHPARSWESSDEWPEPYRLAACTVALKAFIEAPPAESPLESATA